MPAAPNMVGAGTTEHPPSLVSGGGVGGVVAYGAMLVATALALLGISWLGADLSAPLREGPATFGTRAGPAEPQVFLHVLLALLVVLVAARLLGALFRHLQQPAVIGEVIAGILLGPSLLGRVAPGVSAYLLPPTVAPFLSVLAQVGVILFMFLVGLELDTTGLRDKRHATVAISHASIVAPLLMGAVLALWLYPKLSTRDVPFTSFALFMGVSMSVTAFPVLARILKARGMQRTAIGTIALACAAVDDVSAWFQPAGAYWR